jgi:NAD(P) transhydrogenase
MLAQTQFDLVVIGSGPGGEGAAMKAAKEGKSVAVIERYRDVGGGCVHWGTIPSKALRQIIANTADFQANPMYRRLQHHQMQPLHYPDLFQKASQIVFEQVELREGFYARNHVHIIEGHARFLDAQTLEIVQSDESVQEITADNFVIATGSRPWRPPDVDFGHPRIFDADTILGMNFTPRTMTVYGAGVIGCEYASMFRMLDVKVNLINTRSKLLEFLDDEIIDALSYHLRDQGVILRHDEEYEKIEGADDGVVLHLKSGKKIKSDALLWANGRTGNSQTLGLEKLGVTPNHRGHIPVNADYQVEGQPHMYAIGDVVGPPGLASAAYDQGRYAATHLVFGKCDHRLVEAIPSGIYTTPEISSIGKTERELTDQKVPYEVGRALFRHLARAQISGHTVGMLKILFHRDTLAILGVHCFGANASEIVHIGQAIMAQKNGGNNLEYFINTTFNYPTMAEAYRVAALNGLNRLF